MQRKVLIFEYATSPYGSVGKDIPTQIKDALRHRPGWGIHSAKTSVATSKGNEGYTTVHRCTTVVIEKKAVSKRKKKTNK